MSTAVRPALITTSTKMIEKFEESTIRWFLILIIIIITFISIARIQLYSFQMRFTMVKKKINK